MKNQMSKIMKDKMLSSIRKIRTKDYYHAKNLSTNELIKYYHQKAKEFDKLIEEQKPKHRVRKVS
ncbi:MAG: hypothetical protein A3C43_05770 [Candidatus Schekmanbacteria bacterium RIFCSPHIGHO2_02_FULL_38_11]|uniref:Uncharacterized protein n=1 Tax=Candidatus Schekmanbacteria bacterium RIFCSPLOWO2_12_FULL_38_15 TaxID=1817883 RepID=A0A1F7SFS1_9BACT|nr:MAG: hypothetical protein A2043_11420 [Candidatus Schekmanbacteria bacterium GWA2_38_9]OGL49407.1 MAG: hypothetical protein A3H37_06945 [Candidatus Schekmanbacteria bacterium RIFCSPLOWO2_02_FULL_38_14]OGL52632.1 MAG: hypothetical protein A3G31_11770 [Candidatus Schekmanbacteria bacterium RIFCSPLOWO2_12_FULL_38_15]OGL55537.1 MAG: hypothetical protein A3C43_05770 [Candidatus Schekmanbacteria bacterium RIFCSPHIGHO2_02_FULL_38_11]